MNNRLFNIVRYVFSAVQLLLCVWNPLVLAGVAVVLLLLNNWLDDVVFYLGNKSVNVDPSKKGILSPVNGIVTVVEKGVELFSSIKKVNPLTHEEMMSFKMIGEEREERFTHVAIFLNKLNHHVVINPEHCKKIGLHYPHTELLEMVKEGELVGHNGEYLCNDALVFKYPSMYVVVTLDKYVSDYILGSKFKFDTRMIICKGSQCDVYLKGDRDVLVSVGDIVQIGDVVASAKPGYGANPEFKKQDVFDYVWIAMYKQGGVFGLFCKSLLKTLSTFKNPVISVSCVVGVSAYFLSPIISYVAFSSIILFVCLRWYRHFLYSLMNYVGLRPWMEKSYSAISKLSAIWQRRKKN